MAFKTTYSQYDNKRGLFSTEGALDLTTIPSNENKITSSDNALNDLFGQSVAIGCGKIVIGADYAATGPNRTGSVYIFDLDGTQLAKITASDGAGGDYFGHSVAIGNDRIVVGAYRDNSDQGAAYIFKLDGTQLAKITASDGAGGDYFGHSVAVGCGRIVVGAYGDDDNGSQSGSAYIYDLDGTQLAKIVPSDNNTSDNFGHSVAIGNGRIVVGATGAGDLDTGAVYIFDLDENQLAKITPPDNLYPHSRYGQFGSSVAIGYDKIVIGADSDGGGGKGAIYVYDLDGSNATKITASNRTEYDHFGRSVAINSGKIVVGAPSSKDDNGLSVGAIFIYGLDDGIPINDTDVPNTAYIVPNEIRILASDSGGGAYFGQSVAIDNGRMVVGAYGDYKINGYQAGSAYIYNTPNVKDIFSIVDK